MKKKLIHQAAIVCVIAAMVSAIYAGFMGELGALGWLLLVAFYVATGGRCDSSEPRHAAEILEAIELLRREEGDEVAILSDNPDFNGLPDRVVICSGEWTGYMDMQFGGATLVEALRAAVEARRRRTARPEAP